MFPIAANGTFLVTAQGQPFLMMADSAQAMSTNIAGTDIDTYLNTRAGQGFNAIQFDLVTNPYILNNNANYGTIDGIVPFSPAGPLPAPFSPTGSINSTYWNLMDSYVQKCFNLGMVAILNPYESHSDSGVAGGLADLVAAGTTACAAYGAFLGNRYKNFKNVMWQLGNDCLLANSTQYAVLVALAQAIITAAPNQLITIELWFNDSSIATSWVTAFTNIASLGTFNFMNLNGSYVYTPAYGNCLQAYNETTTSFLSQAGTNNTPQVPSIMLESNYEFENIWNGSGGVGGTLVNLRRQGYWAVLSGQSGQIYGNGYVWGFETSNGSNIIYPGNSGGWPNNLASPGYSDLLRWKNFFTAISWQNLLPDQTHVVGTAGFGTGSLTSFPESNNYVAVAADSLSGSAQLAVAYFPQGNSNTLTVDMTRFAASITAQWFDPTNGTFTTVSGSPFANTGTHNFTPTGNNSAGDPDWVLQLKA